MSHVTRSMVSVAIALGLTCASQAQEPSDNAQKPLRVVSAYEDATGFIWDDNGKAAYIPGKIYVTNFWATYCSPCLEELPAFQKLQKLYPEQVVVTLVSVDFKKDEPKILPRLQERGITLDPLRLANADQWIEVIDPPVSDTPTDSWGGGIPATQIFKAMSSTPPTPTDKAVLLKKKHYAFIERDIGFDELHQIVKDMLDTPADETSSTDTDH